MHPDHEFHPLTVAEVRTETADARSFVLTWPEDLSDSFKYLAGQFCTLRAHIDGTEVIRSYSMSSSPELDEPFTITVKRVPGGVMSNWMNDQVRPGDVLDVAPPTGAFVLRDADTDIVAYAGGSGITPIIAITKTALASTQRRVRLLFANRDPDSVIFRRDLDALQRRWPDRLEVQHHLDHTAGFLDVDACAAFVHAAPGADVYICGPGPFMDIVTAGVESCALAPSAVFVERFEAAPLPTDPGAGSETTEVTIRLSGRTQTVAYSAGETILATARRAAMTPPFSCQSGNCATCMAYLESGEVTMQANNVLTEEEVAEGWILTCQSIPTSPTVSVNYDA